MGRLSALLGEDRGMEEELTTAARERTIDFARVVAFTDGVFAIAITLLVLGLDIPAGQPDLSELLRAQESNLVAYALSFIVIGRLWLIHHSFVGGLRRFDTWLIHLTLFYLAWICLIPFTSELLGNYGGHVEAVVIYAAVIVGVTLTFAAKIAYAYRRDLMQPGYRLYARAHAAPGVLAASTGFVLSIPVAFVNPTAAELLWLVALFLPHRIGRWLGDRLLGADTHPADI